MYVYGYIHMGKCICLHVCIRTLAKHDEHALLFIIVYLVIF